jgi:hypothetical protein
LKLGPHWFAYSSLDLRSTPFSYYDAYDADREIKLHLIQGFVGYTRSIKRASVLVKAGQLASAFGSFPLHYDDADNSLLDQPLAYTAYLKLRADQLPCGVRDLLRQRGYQSEVSFYCKGSDEESYGLTPVTLYGLPGVEVDLAVSAADFRFQLTNSSPANPQNLLSRSQHAQWAAGGGYTLAHGLRVGVSAFRGPFLDRAVAGLLPQGHNVRDFPATGAGVDVQWARGRLSTNGEWQWFRFSYPKFRSSPAAWFAYGEAKTIITPRTYVALRLGLQQNSRVADFISQSQESFNPNRQSYEIALGYRPNRRQLLKLGYEWVTIAGLSGTRDNVLGLQFVTSFQALSKSWR